MELFHDVRFPLDVSLGARGGPTRKTTVLPLASGAEHRNSPHRHSRRRFDAGVGVKSLADIQLLLAFWEARGGQLHSFRFRDPVDHTATVEVVGDGERTRYPCVKTYGDGEGSYTRPLHFAAVVSPSGVRAEDGELVFDTPPAPGLPVSVEVVFDTCVRFDSDRLDIGLDDISAGSVPSLPLIEVLPHELDA